MSWADRSGGDDARACACATSAKGFSRWALRMALFVLRRRSGAQRTVRRRVATPRRILLCTAFLVQCLFFPLEHAATKRGAPAKVGCCGVAREQSSTRLLLGDGARP